MIGTSGDVADARKRRRGGLEAASASASDILPDSGAVTVAGKSPRRNASAGGKSSSSAGVASSNSAAGSSQQVLPPFSLAQAPGVERLTPQERGLCEHLQLLPHQYQQIKSTVVSLALARGHVRCEDAAESLVYVGACYREYVPFLVRTFNAEGFVQ
jgi:hypothetical protein